MRDTDDYPMSSSLRAAFMAREITEAQREAITRLTARNRTTVEAISLEMFGTVMPPERLTRRQASSVIGALTDTAPARWTVSHGR